MNCSGDDKVLSIFGFSGTDNNNVHDGIIPFAYMTVADYHTSKEFTAFQMILVTDSVSNFHASECQA